MKMTLTDKFILATGPGDAGRVDVFDALTPGLCLRVTADRKSWSLVFTAPGTTTRARLSLGTYPATGLKAARERATEARGHVEAGTDPRTLNAAPVKPKTIRELAEERLAMKVRGKLRTADEIEWRYNKYILPLIGDVAVEAFRVDPHYNSVIDPLTKRGKTRMAGVVHVDLTSLFDFAGKRGALPGRNYMEDTESPSSYTPRERWLPLEEIKTLWARLPVALHKTPDTQQIVRLLLATLQRSNEVTGISRPEIELAKRLWTIPAERSKNGYAHVVPLNDLAMSIILEQMRKTNGLYLFPREGADEPRTSCDVSTAINYAHHNGAKFHIAKWTAHDLRRTGATHMSLADNGLQIPELHIEHVLNHRTATKKSITSQTYNQNQYIPEKREALDKWGAFLAQLVGAETGLRVAA